MNADNRPAVDGHSQVNMETCFQLLTESVLDYSLFTIDPGGLVTSWNRGAERMFGYPGSQILGQSWECLYLHDARSRGEPARELESARPRGFLEIEGWRVRRDGSQLNGYISLTSLANSGGGVAGFAVVTRDVTEHRRSMHELDDQKRRLHSIVDTAVDAIVIIDEHGVIESFNPAAERMFGYTAAEMLGENINRLMPQPFAHEHTGYIQRYLRTGRAKIIGIGREVQGLRKDGSLFPADLAVSEFRDGKPLFTGIVRDISERKRMEAEVLQIADAEQRRIGQELHDDLQQQLSGLKMIARSVADSLLALTADHPALTDLQARVDRIARGLRDANQSLRQLARGLVPLQIDAEGLPDALAQLASQVSESHDIPCRFTSDLPGPLTDGLPATQLYRVIQEAVNNALKHSQASAIDITMRLTEQTLTLEVADDGVGFDETPTTSGRGLQIMAYRARMIGALLTVRPGQPRGTVVRCDLASPG
jgi:two-component system, LuxR family, sensor kinase FixL